MKDNFSNVSSEYSKFRPGYPDELFKFLKSEITGFDAAWDCGTGTGQVALPLSQMFKLVYATDISEKQLEHAPVRENIVYSREPAEKTGFGPEMFDLITVAQAIHWFDFEKFYREVNRTLKQEGLIAVIGYGSIKTNEPTQKLINHLYHDIVGPYWDPERKFLVENYRTIPFPFREIPVPAFKTTLDWEFPQLIGYLKTWSAVQHFIKYNGFDPLEKIIPEIERSFGNRSMVTFPVLLRLGKRE